MSIVTLAEAKPQIRVELDETAEDGLIQAYLDAAEAAAAQYLNRAIYESDVGTDETGVVMTWDIRVAVYLILGALYFDREGAEELPKGARVLLNPYRLEMGV